jgi:hypothetical protein
MSPDERTRIELAQRLAEQFGEDVAAYLMETVPPFSWHEVATKSDLRALQEHLESTLGLSFESLEAKLGGRIGVVGSRIDAVESLIDERTNQLRTEARELQKETIAAFRGELVRNSRQMMYGMVAAIGVVAASIIAAVKL